MTARPQPVSNLGAKRSTSHHCTPSAALLETPCAKCSSSQLRQRVRLPILVLPAAQKAASAQPRSSAASPAPGTCAASARRKLTHRPRRPAAWAAAHQRRTRYPFQGTVPPVPGIPCELSKACAFCVWSRHRPYLILPGSMAVIYRGRR